MADRDGPPGAARVARDHAARAGRADDVGARAALPAGRRSCPSRSAARTSSRSSSPTSVRPRRPRRSSLRCASCPRCTSTRPATTRSRTCRDICQEPTDADADDRVVGTAHRPRRRRRSTSSSTLPAPTRRSALTVLQFRHLGGALARGTAEQGPNAAIDEPYLVFTLGVPMVPELVPAIEASIAAVQQAVAAKRSGRTFYTFLCADSDVTRAFPAESLARLREIKQDVDPNGRVPQQPSGLTTGASTRRALPQTSGQGASSCRCDRDATDSPRTLSTCRGRHCGHHGRGFHAVRARAHRGSAAHRLPAHRRRRRRRGTRAGHPRAAVSQVAARRGRRSTAGLRAAQPGQRLRQPHPPRLAARVRGRVPARGHRRPTTVPAQLDDRDEIWTMLRSLPERQRAALVLRYFHDLPDDEIGAALGCREGTVRSLVSRGLAALREQRRGRSPCWKELGMNPPTELETRLRASLSENARHAPPGAPLADRILAELDAAPVLRPRGGWRTWTFPLLAAAAIAAVAFALVGVGAARHTAAPPIHPGTQAVSHPAPTVHLSTSAPSTPSPTATTCDAAPGHGFPRLRPDLRGDARRLGARQRAVHRQPGPSVHGDPAHDRWQDLARHRWRELQRLRREGMRLLVRAAHPVRQPEHRLRLRPERAVHDDGWRRAVGAAEGAGC